MSSKWSRELAVACTAVQHCAVLTRRLQRETLSQDSQVKKSDFSPVTTGDFAAQALLTSAIHGAFENDSFLAEESADELRINEPLLDHVWRLVEHIETAFAASNLVVPASKAEVCSLIDLGGKQASSHQGRMWVFDPIDGTATFLRGQQFAINCAFLVHGKEEIGIIGCPNLAIDSEAASEDAVDQYGLGLMIFAVRGEGTWVRPMQRDGTLAPATKIERHGDKATMDRLVWSDCASYSSTIIQLHQQVASKLHTAWPGVDLFSSLMKYAALGLGRSHLVIRIFKYASWRSNMWDHAGGVLIFEEAGGKVTDLNGNAIDFTQGRKMSANYGLVCAPSAVHSQVLKLVQETLKTYEETSGPIPWSK